MEISVNQKTTTVGKAKLHFTLFIYLIFHRKKMGSITILEGVAGKADCICQFKTTKKSFLLLKVAKKLKETIPIGLSFGRKDFEDEYSAAIKILIVEYALKESVFCMVAK
jgi:hypothetical protein